MWDTLLHCNGVDKSFLARSLWYSCCADGDTEIEGQLGAKCHLDRSKLL
jgi:hypothetical protein